jgi:hypothetical protein
MRGDIDPARVASIKKERCLSMSAVEERREKDGD